MLPCKDGCGVCDFVMENETRDSPFDYDDYPNWSVAR